LVRGCPIPYTDPYVQRCDSVPTLAISHKYYLRVAVSRFLLFLGWGEINDAPYPTFLERRAMEDLNNEPKCIICDTFCESEERGFNMCPTCRSMLAGKFIMICLTCSNAQFITLCGPVLKKIDSFRKDCEVHDVYESIIAVYDTCPRCYTKIIGKSTIH
jgi:hypothetical protein